MTAPDRDTLLAHATREYHRYHPAWLAVDSHEYVVEGVAVDMGVNGCPGTFTERKDVAREVIEREKEEKR